MQDAGLAPFCQPQHVDHPNRRRLDRLNRVGLVCLGRGGTGQVVDLVDLQKDRPHDVVPDQFEFATGQ